MVCAHPVVRISATLRETSPMGQTATMSTITASELKLKPTEQWREAAKTGDLVVTEQGEPVAVRVPITDRNLVFCRCAGY